MHPTPAGLTCTPHLRGTPAPHTCGAHMHPTPEPPTHQPEAWAGCLGLSVPWVGLSPRIVRGMGCVHSCGTRHGGHGGHGRSRRSRPITAAGRDACCTRHGGHGGCTRDPCSCGTRAARVAVRVGVAPAWASCACLVDVSMMPPGDAAVTKNTCLLLSLNTRRHKICYTSECNRCSLEMPP